MKYRSIVENIFKEEDIKTTAAGLDTVEKWFDLFMHQMYKLKPMPFVNALTSDQHRMVYTIVDNSTVKGRSLVLAICINLRSDPIDGMCGGVFIPKSLPNEDPKLDHIRKTAYQFNDINFENDEYKNSYLGFIELFLGYNGKVTERTKAQLLNVYDKFETSLTAETLEHELMHAYDYFKREFREKRLNKDYESEDEVVSRHAWFNTWDELQNLYRDIVIQLERQVIKGNKVDIDFSNKDKFLQSIQRYLSLKTFGILYTGAGRNTDDWGEDAERVAIDSKNWNKLIGKIYYYYTNAIVPNM